MRNRKKDRKKHNNNNIMKDEKTIPKTDLRI